MGYRVVVVGATGNVGREMLNVLAEREFPIEELAAVATWVCPNLSYCGTYVDLHQGLAALVADAASLKVFCGSLYLIGHFFATEVQAQRAPFGEVRGSC